MPLHAENRETEIFKNFETKPSLFKDVDILLFSGFVLMYQIGYLPFHEQTANICSYLITIFMNNEINVPSKVLQCTGS